MQYFEPNFMNEALVVLERFGARCKILAGGTLLGAQLRAAPTEVDAVVNVKRVPSLKDIEESDRGLRIGALATAHVLAAHPLVIERAPLVAQAAAGLGARQLRTLATIGGNACSAHPSADLAVALLASDAVVEYATLSEDKRSVPIERFLLDPNDSVPTGALVTGFWLPLRDGGARFCKLRTRRAFELALVSVAAWVHVKRSNVVDCRIALGGVAATPVPATNASSALKTGALAEPRIREAAARAADADARPQDDLRASAPYRRHLVHVLVARALREIAALPQTGSH